MDANLEFEKFSKALLNQKNLKITNPEQYKGEIKKVIIVSHTSGKNFVLKVRSIKNEKGDDNCDDKLAMCMIESEILLSCRHKNVVEIITEFVIESYHCIQLNYYEQSLESWMKENAKNPISTTIFTHFAKQIIEGIEFIHSKNYVMKNLTPKNILISKDGYIKLNGICQEKLSQAPPLATNLIISELKQYLINYPPESIEDILKEKPIYSYSKTKDLWSIGICLSLFGGSEISDVMNFNQKDSQISDSPLLDAECNSLIKFILKNDVNQRPTLPLIKIFIFEEIINKKPKVILTKQIIKSDEIKSKEELEKFYNSRDFDFDVSKISEIEKDCLNNQDKIESLLILGEISNYLSQHDQAIRWFIKAIRLNPNDPYPYLGISDSLLLKVVLEDQDCSNQIEEYIKMAEDLCPNYWFYYRVKAIGCGMQKDYQMAYYYSNKALEINPKNIFIIALNYYFKQLTTGQCYLSELENMKIDFPTRSYYYFLGQIAFMDKQKDKALHYMLKELEFNPNYPMLLFNIGNLYGQSNNIIQQVEYYTKSLKAAPKFRMPRSIIEKLYDQLNLN